MISGVGVDAVAGVAAEGRARVVAGVGAGACAGMTPGTSVAVASGWAIIGEGEGIRVVAGGCVGTSAASGCEQATRSSTISADKCDAQRMFLSAVILTRYMSRSFL